MTSWEKILARLNEWNDALRSNEQATIQGIILPALHLLGYDTENPEVVFPQETDKDGLRPDFVIYDLAQNIPRFVIEAKAINVPLRNHYDKVLRYMNSGKVRWYFLTNGLEWELYDRNIPIPLHNCRVANINLTKAKSFEMLRHLLAPNLQEPNIEEITNWAVVNEFEGVVNSVPWTTQKLAWETTEHLPKVVRTSLASLRTRYPEKTELIDSLQKRLEENLSQVTNGSDVGLPEATILQAASNHHNSETIPLSASRWRYAFIDLVIWAYGFDKNKLLSYLNAPKKGSTARLHPTAYKDGKGNDLTKPLPDGTGHFYINYSAEDTQKEIKRLVDYFPELRGKRITVGAEYLQL